MTRSAAQARTTCSFLRNGKVRAARLAISAMTFWPRRGIEARVFVAVSHEECAFLRLANEGGWHRQDRRCALRDKNLPLERRDRRAEPHHWRERAVSKASGEHHSLRREHPGGGRDAITRAVPCYRGHTGVGMIASAPLQEPSMQRSQEVKRARMAVVRGPRAANDCFTQAGKHLGKLAAVEDP